MKFESLSHHSQILIEEKALLKQKENLKLSTQEDLQIKLLTAEADIAEERKTIVNRCAHWMRCTVWIAAIFLLFFFILTMIDFISTIFWPQTLISTHFSIFTNERSHLLMFILSLLSAYSLLAPYLLLKGILTQKNKTETPFTELSQDSYQLTERS
jgi:hypothetical protein